MEPQNIDILDLIPQRRPFVAVDRLVSYTEPISVTELTVVQDDLFCRQGVFSVYGVIEHIAQSCAARIGYKNLSAGQGIKLGFIGAIKDFTAERPVLVGERLTTTIEVINEVFSMTLVEATVRVEGEKVAGCQMKIALSE